MTDGHAEAMLHALSDAVLAISAELSVDRALQKMVDAARELAHARYAALGIPDDHGGFEQFITAGMSDALIAAIGPLPRTHGLLGAMLEDSAPFRTPDIKEDDRFLGWPAAHPTMGSFMGVPIVSKGQIIGAFYLTDKQDADTFTFDDQRLIEMLAAHAAIAIENARLFERSRELSVIEERNRLARDLHDSVTQTLFSVVLNAEATGTMLERDPAQAKEQLQKLQSLAQDALREMRSLIFELRPAALASDGFEATLRKHIEVLSRVRRCDIDMTVCGERQLADDVQQGLFRIAQEALNNALNHANAKHIAVSVDLDREPVRMSVRDDGEGFDVAAAETRSKRLGLISMRERAEALGGTLSIESTTGEGTSVTAEVPVG
ncbi:MAG TPA: GAF domain-containing sensor histidine kinase [Dehalococcoidia bacterium]